MDTSGVSKSNTALILGSSRGTALFSPRPVVIKSVDGKPVNFAADGIRVSPGIHELVVTCYQSLFARNTHELTVSVEAGATYTLTSQISPNKRGQNIENGREAGIAVYDSGGVVEDDAERMSFTRSQFTDPMPHFHPMIASRPFHRPFIDGEHDTMSLFEPNHLDARLHAWSLFDQDELAAFEISKVTEQHDDLQRKNMLAIQILVQPVVIACTVSEDQRRGPRLAVPVTALEHFRMRIRKANIAADSLLPRVGFSLPVTVLAHDDVAAKCIVFRIQSPQRCRIPVGE
jgi:hypothetical protein